MRCRAALCLRHRAGLLTLASVAVLTAGCATGQGAGSPPPRRAAQGVAAEPGSHPDVERLQAALARLEQDLKEKEATLASLEERHTALEIELASVLEEILRSKASVRTVQNRALATSRIAEVRVQLESVPQAHDPEVASRLQRANELLNRADRALEERNFGGAAYLAERASDLVRQARMAGQIRASSADQSAEVIPIVPPRSLEVLTSANLREGPGRNRRRVGGIDQGEQVLAVARSGDWFHVETDSGRRAWIHRSLVK